jgi:enoyl-CoA hydratase
LFSKYLLCVFVVNVSERDGIYFISINRPEKKNCVNHATALQLIDAFEKFDADEKANIAIFYGEGKGKMF